MGSDILSSLDSYDSYDSAAAHGRVGKSLDRWSSPCTSCVCCCAKWIEHSKATSGGRVADSAVRSPTENGLAGACDEEQKVVRGSFAVLCAAG